MNSLLHNPLTDLALPYFLVIYAALGVLALVAGGVSIWLSDGTRDDSLPDESSDLPDPYEVAYLNGGAAQVARVAIADLLARGYVELSSAKRRFSLFTPPKMLRRAAGAPDPSNLTPIQKAAWNWVGYPRLPKLIVHRNVGLDKLIRPLCHVCAGPLDDRRLLETAVHRYVRIAVAWILATAIAGVGVYKLIATAISGESESICLMVLMSAGLVCTAIICRPVRLSDLGHRYRESLHLEYADITAARTSATDPATHLHLLRTALSGNIDFRPAAEPLRESSDHAEPQQDLVRT